MFHTKDPRSVNASLHLHSKFTYTQSMSLNTANYLTRSPDGYLEETTLVKNKTVRYQRENELFLDVRLHFLFFEYLPVALSLSLPLSVCLSLSYLYCLMY